MKKKDEFRSFLSILSLVPEVYQNKIYVPGKETLLFSIPGASKKEGSASFHFGQLFGKHLATNYLVSNFKKSLNFKLSLSKEGGFWHLAFKLFQENARATTFCLSLKLDSESEKVLSSFDFYPWVPASIDFLEDIEKIRQKNQDDNTMLYRVIRELNSKLYALHFLSEEALQEYHGLSSLLLEQKNKVFYTYDFLQKSYDENVSRIDDGKRYNAVFEDNVDFQKLINLCEQIFKKFDFFPTKNV